MSGNQQVEGGGCTCRAGADHGNALPSFWLQFKWERWINVLVPHGLENLVARVAMAVANRDRFVNFIATAVVFARRWADTTKDAWEWNGALEDARRLTEL